MAHCKRAHQVAPMVLRAVRISCSPRANMTLKAMVLVSPCTPKLMVVLSKFSPAHTRSTAGRPAWRVNHRMCSSLKGCSPTRQNTRMDHH